MKLLSALRTKIVVGGTSKETTNPSGKGISLPEPRELRLGGKSTADIKGSIEDMSELDIAIEQEGARIEAEYWEEMNNIG